MVPNIGTLAYYPNRNSLSYIETYSLNGVKDFIRTTLRHPAFCSGWDAIIQLGLTNETPKTIPTNETVKGWFNKHLQANNLTNLYATFIQNKALKAQLEFIGLEENEVIPARLYESNASILQWLLETKWMLANEDKDMVVMMHEIDYLLNNQPHHIQSSLVLKGQNSIQTAMASTVGLPLAMGVCAYLKGEISTTGVHIPIHPSIYNPILKSLAEEGIEFTEIAS
jgi:saccharopine dehydrogenase (NADP+, L-glutamate forming)